MAEVTPKTQEVVNYPGMLLYTVTATDGETLTTPFTSVSGAVITYGEDPSTGNPWGYTVSGGTLTLQCTGASDVVISVLVFGN